MKLTALERLKRQLAKAARVARHADRATWLAWRATRDLVPLAEACGADGCDPLTKEILARIAKEAQERGLELSRTGDANRYPIEAAARLLGAEER